MNKNLIGIVAVGVLVIGGGYIVYSGRPVVQMEREVSEDEISEVIDRDDDEDSVPTADEKIDTSAIIIPPSIAIGEPNPSTVAATEEPKIIQNLPNETAPSETSSTGAKSYTMADVQAHDSVESCWATINNSVYDLTSWVARHPGGPDKIISLCGTDGSDRFNRQHSTFLKAQEMLILLKIGVHK